MSASRLLPRALLVSIVLLAVLLSVFTSEGSRLARADDSQAAGMGFKVYHELTTANLVCDLGAVGRLCTIVGDDPFHIRVFSDTPPPVGFLAYRIDVAYDGQLTYINQAGTSENRWPACNTALATESKGVNTYELICSTGGSQNQMYTGAIASLHFACPATGGNLQVDLAGGFGNSASLYLAAGPTSTFYLKSVDKGGSPVAESVVIECLVDTDDDGIADVVEKLYPCMDQTVADANLDGDSDGLKNGEELDDVGTDPCVADTDDDGIDDGDEVNGVVSPEGLGTFFTDPLEADTDQDGCDDGQEIGLEAIFGGRRDPTNFWDFYDVWTVDSQNPGQYKRDGFIDIKDIAPVASRFLAAGGGTSIEDALTPPTSPTDYHASYDRGPMVGPNRWNTSGADGFVSITDVAAIANQFFHGC